MEFWKEIMVTLGRNKWRSLMTMFGVFWGIWMLIVLTGVGNGISNSVLPGFDRMPTNVAFFFPNATTMPYRGLQEGRSWRFDMSDLEAVRHRLGGKVKAVGGVVFTFGANFTRGENHGSFGINGILPTYRDTQPMEMVYGRFINGVDVAERRKVCVIGEDIYTSLFPEGGDPCGMYVQAGSLYYMVIGVVRQPSARMQMGGNLRTTALLPMTTVQQAYYRGHDVDDLIVQFKDDYLASDYQDEVQLLLKQRHLVSPDDKGALFVFNMQEMLLQVRAIFFGINALLWIVGMGMLFAGLVGISNIVLVTVKERTQEIGVRRAIGASPRVILMQIMSESVVLTCAAGVCGLVLGVWALEGLSAMMPDTPPEMRGPQLTLVDPSVSFAFTVGALAIIVAGGLLAGLAPAMRAMKIKAIDALRDE
ncbi:MAG: ABC transporter permease [Bacteroidaceae bacterium]|nr:ABC transporter permease [Bacteroidaceae bacterium]